MEQRLDEWNKIEAEARRLLANPDLLPNQEGLGQFYVAIWLWHYPSFEAQTVWIVLCSRQDGVRYLVREVVWDQREDAQREDAQRVLALLEGVKHGFQTRPTFATRTVELAPDEVEARLAKLRRISLPPFVENTVIGCDGETFGLAVETGFLDASLSWWCEGPPEWQEITGWFNEMRAYLMGVLDTAG